MSNDSPLSQLNIKATKQSSNKGRLEFIAIIFLLLLPFILGAYLYSSGWRPSNTTNRGELIQPVLTLNHQDLQQNRWTLLLLNDSPCNDICQQKLDGLRRVRAALAKEINRTRHAWLGENIGIQAQMMLSLQPDLLVIEQNKSKIIPNAEKFLNGEILIIDPKGRLVLRYKANAELKDVRSDLERLLKTSWIE